MPITESLFRLREEIAVACAVAGRDPAGITLVAVSKTHSADAVREAHAAGIRHFGENRVQEFLAKA
jgi:PLP dependent protein